MRPIILLAQKNDNHSPMSGSLPLPTKMRASEKVRNFLERELLVHSAVSGTRLPTIKEISRHLKVSAFTVHSVVSKLTKEGQIVTVPGSGLFANPSHKGELRSELPVVLISIHEAEFTAPGLTWGKEICAAILREMTNGPDRMLMRPFFVDRLGQSADALRNEVGKSSALVAFPSPLNGPLLEEFAMRKKPIIFITSPAADTVHNCIAINNYRISWDIASAWAKSGRRHVAVLLKHLLKDRGGYVHTLAGFQAAYQRENTVRFSYETVNLTDQSLERCLKRLLAKSPALDAIYSPSSEIITRAIRHLTAEGFSLPKQVSLISGSGISMDDCPLAPQTTLQLPFHEIGQAAARMVVATLKTGSLTQPTVLLKAGIKIGRTTRECENELFCSAGV